MGMSAADIWPREPVPGGVLPDTARWKDTLAAHPLTRRGPLVLDDAERLYLRRYWQLEQDIARQLGARSDAPPPADEEPGSDTGITRPAVSGIARRSAAAGGQECTSSSRLTAVRRARYQEDDDRGRHRRAPDRREAT